MVDRDKVNEKNVIVGAIVKYFFEDIGIKVYFGLYSVPDEQRTDRDHGRLFAAFVHFASFFTTPELHAKFITLLLTFAMDSQSFREAFAQHE